MTRDDPTPAVVADTVTVRYGDHLAVERLSFALPRGAVSAVIGPNGSGKSTLLRVTSGVLEPTSGTLSVLGHAATARRGDVAHVMQATVVAEEVPLTVREIVRMGRYARRGPWRRLEREDHRAVAEALDRVAITDLADRHLRELSGGQRQRVYVAQGLAQRADVLLLDEPVTGLDLPSQERIRTVIDEEVAAGRTVVLTTHDVGTAASADHVLVLATHLVASGEPATALTADALTHAYSGTVFRTADGEVILGDPHQHAAIEPHRH